MALALVAISGCVISTVERTTDGHVETESDSDSGDSEEPSSVYDHYPELSAPCQIEPAAPTQLLVTTTDFASGGLSVVDLNSLDVLQDVALTSTDAVARAHNGHVFVVNRYLYDNVDVLAPADGWQSQGQYGLTLSGFPSVNPHSLHFAEPADTRGYVVLFGAPAVAVIDFSAPATQAQVDAISLQKLADADGIPEASAGIICGSTMFVSVQRLDRNNGWGPVDHDYLAALDLSKGEQIDVFDDPQTLQGIALQGRWARQFRADPQDPNGHTALALTTGIERIDLASGAVSWAVTPEQFAQANVSSAMLPQAFDLDASGTRALISAFRPDFSAIDIYRVDLDDSTATLEEVASGFLSAELTLEVVGDRLYFGDTTPGQSGLRVFDVTPSGPLVETDLGVPQPIPLGLPPYRVQASGG